MRKSLMIAAFVVVLGSSCSKQAAPCTVAKNPGNGIATIVCPDGTSVDIEPGGKGDPGARGSAGTGCSVSRDVDAGLAHIECEDGTSATVVDGPQGSSGSSCSIYREQDAGFAVIRCADGTTTTISDGVAGTSCTVSRTPDAGVALIQCADGTSAVISDGTPGQAATVVVDSEPPGVHCPTGGVKLTAGASVSYVCNGSATNRLGVDAGPDVVALSGSQVQLSGSVDAGILGVRWNQVVGPSVTLERPQSLRPSFTAPASDAGLGRSIVMQLQATDGVLLESDLVVLTLNQAPAAPVAQLTPSNLTDSDTLTCTAQNPSATDSEGDALTYGFAWTRNGQPFAGATTSTMSSSVPPSATQPGDVFACVITATDALGASAVSMPAVATIGGGLPCQWTLEVNESMSSLPAGSTLKNGFLNGQAVAMVGGRAAWQHTSDWNMTFLGAAFDAGYEGVAMEADVFIPSATTFKAASFSVQVNPVLDAYSAFQNDIIHGASAAISCASSSANVEISGGQYASASNTSVCCSNGPPAKNFFPDGGSTTIPCSTVVNRWASLRLEVSKRLGRGNVLLNGAVVATFATDYDDTGTRPLFQSSGASVTAANVAFSNVKTYRGVCR